MFPEWTVVVGLLIGAAIGSFLNVVIYRMPLGKSLSDPKHSFCPACGHRLGVPDLIPLFSWLFLRGRCRHCRSRIPARYFFVEVVTGGLWAAFWWQYLVTAWDPARAVALMAFSACLVAATYIDLRWFIIPDEINAFMLAIGFAYNVTLYAQGRPEATTWGMPSALAGALFGVVALWSVTFLGRLLFRKDAMGHGDIKMARGIGAVLFPTAAAMSFAVAVALGAVLGAVQILVRRRSEPEPEPEEQEGNPLEDEEPESIESILRCGLGYLLCIDVIGLAVPRLYEWWFREEAHAVESVEEEDVEVEATVIPFGPYLALGAIVVALFEGPLSDLATSYWKWATGERP